MDPPQEPQQSGPPTLDDFKALQDALKKLDTAMFEFVTLSDKVPNMMNTGPYMYLFEGGYYTKLIEAVRFSRIATATEMLHYEETKNMTAGEKATFYLKKTDGSRA